MDASNEEAGRAGRQRFIRWLALLGVGLLLITTLMSNTLTTLSLTKITVEQPVPGRLELRAAGEAAVVPAKILELSGQVGWPVSKVLVRSGDQVQEGQTLVLYGGLEAEQQIQAERHQLERLKLPMEQLEYAYVEAARADDQARLLEARLAIEAAKADIKAQEERISYMEEVWERNRKLTAPADGTVLDVGAVAGMSGGASPDIRMIQASEGFEVILSVPHALAGTYQAGDEILLASGEDESKQAKGRVTEIEEPSGGHGLQNEKETTDAVHAESRITVKLDGKAAETLGETVHYSLSKVSENTGILISRQALLSDRDGAYVFTLEERRGSLSNAYYAVKRDVTILEADEFTVLVQEGDLNASDRVVVHAGQQLQDGERVRLD